MILITISCKESTKEKPNDTDDVKTNPNIILAAEVQPKLNGIDGNCVAPADWFTGNMKAPDPSNFPQGNDVTNCDFHLVSWQYFLWLTEEVDGKLRFESYYTNKAIYPDSKDDQYHILDIVEQAQSKGMLVDQNNRAVYSSILINDTYRNWILKNKLYDREAYDAFAATNNFPVGSVSLKTAWKIVDPSDDVSKLYTTKRDIELLDVVDGHPRIPKDAIQVQKDVEVALVGLHIAVVVEGHPEMIWATFEYDDNAPDYNPDQNNDSIVSDKKWLFYKANTLAKNSNENNATSLAFVNQADQTIEPVTEVARQFKNGGGSSTNQGNIEHLNGNAKSQLKGNNSIWQNYFEVGAVWFNTTIDTLKPGWSPNNDASMVTGSLKLSNSTIETFTQRFQNENQCFSCHNTLGELGTRIMPAKNFNLSHVLQKNYQEGREKPISNQSN